MPPYCWQIPSRRLKGKQAEESKGLITACSSFWYEIWYSFWYDGGKNATFLEFRYFFTYNISRKTNEFSIRNDIWLSFRNLQFDICPLFDMIYDCHFEMRGTKIWLSLWYDTGSGSLRIRVPEPKFFEGKILIYRFSLRSNLSEYNFSFTEFRFVENIFFRLQNFI